MVSTYEVMLYLHVKCRDTIGIKFDCIRNDRILCKTRAEKTHGSQMVLSISISSCDFNNLG